MRQTIVVIFSLCFFVQFLFAKSTKKPVHYVDNFIGVRDAKSSRILGPQLPNAYINPSPFTAPKINKYVMECYVIANDICGFWQSAHWKPDAAMFRKDWTEKPNAAVWRELVSKKWKTNVTALSNRKGMVNTRGHLGKYEISVTKNGVTKKVIHQLSKTENEVIIKL